MHERVKVIFAGMVLLLPVAALADSAPPKSERAMTPDSANAGQSPNGKSERAMSKDSANPGSAPNGTSERAMEPAKSTK